MTFFNGLDTYARDDALFGREGGAVTYGELLGLADEVAGRVGRRCLVFMAGTNRLEAVAGYLGFLRSGVVPTLLNHAIDPALLLNLISRYHPAYVWWPGNGNGVIPGETVFRSGDYALIRTGLVEDYVLHGDLGLLLTTSGSTGSPKLVRQSYANLRSNTEAIVRYLEIRAADRAITTLPMYYTYGLSILNTHLARGASVVLTDGAMMESDFWRLLRGREATTFGGVPYIYEMLRKLRFQTMDLPSLRYLTQAGGRLAPDIMADFVAWGRRKGIPFIVMYGQTEATARMAWLPWSRAADKIGSIGVAIPGGRFWLADSDGAELSGADAMGELVYEGANVMMGYAETRHDLARNDEYGGRLFTGDMARVDEEGFYYITGRKKRFVKLFGSRVSLDEVEELLRREGYDCACAGVDDALRVYVADSDGVEGVSRWLADSLHLNRVGFSVQAVERIPRNESGKVLYSGLP